VHEGSFEHLFEKRCIPAPVPRPGAWRAFHKSPTAVGSSELFAAKRGRPKPQQVSAFGHLPQLSTSLGPHWPSRARRLSVFLLSFSFFSSFPFLFLCLPQAEFRPGRWPPGRGNLNLGWPGKTLAPRKSRQSRPSLLTRKNRRTLPTCRAAEFFLGRRFLCLLAFPANKLRNKTFFDTSRPAGAGADATALASFFNLRPELLGGRARCFFRPNSRSLKTAAGPQQRFFAPGQKRPVMAEAFTEGSAPMLMGPARGNIASPQSREKNEKLTVIFSDFFCAAHFVYCGRTEVSHLKKFLVGGESTLNNVRHEQKHFVLAFSFLGSGKGSNFVAKLPWRFRGWGKIPAECRHPYEGWGADVGNSCWRTRANGKFRAQFIPRLENFRNHWRGRAEHAPPYFCRGLCGQRPGGLNCAVAGFHNFINGVLKGRIFFARVRRRPSVKTRAFPCCLPVFFPVLESVGSRRWITA